MKGECRPPQNRERCSVTEKIVRGYDLIEVEAAREGTPTEAGAETILSYFKPDDAALRKLDRKDLKCFIEF